MYLQINMKEETEFTDEEIRNIMNNFPDGELEAWINLAFSGMWADKYSEQIRRVVKYEFNQSGKMAG